MKTVRLTMAQALVRYLCAQSTEIDGKSEPLFAGVFGIFGHGNVTCMTGSIIDFDQSVLGCYEASPQPSPAGR